MLGRNHAAMGLLLGESLLMVGHVNSSSVAPVLIGLTAGSLWPDVDEPNSLVSRSFGLISMAFASGVNRISGGHRQATHSPIGIALMSSCAYLLGLSHLGHLILAIGAVFIVLKSVVPWSVRVFALGGTIGAAVISLFVGFWLSGVGLLPLVLGFGLGSLIHLLGDWVTPSGVPWLWPLSSHHFSLDLWSTDSFTEHLVGLGLWAVVLLGGWHLIGAVALPSVSPTSAVHSTLASKGFHNMLNYVALRVDHVITATIGKLQTTVAALMQHHGI